MRVQNGVDRVGGCGVPDTLCDDDTGDGLVAGRSRLSGVDGLLEGGFPGVAEIPNPMGELGSIVTKAAADAWTAAMLAIWDSGLFVLRIVTFSELFLTPDLGAEGPGRDVYGFALWLALALVVILTVIQLGAAAFKREGKGLARALVGAGQFVVVCATWFGYCAAVVAACGAISRALITALLGVNTWPEWDPFAGLGAQDVADATVATVLAFLGVFLWLAAIGHILVFLARAAALLVLTTTGPLSAAGLASDFTRAWFWKSLRWFHAAAFTPVLMVTVLGVGVQMSSGVAAHLADGTQQAIGTALPAVMLILVSVVAPVALFKLLAFVDPGTPSGASFRQGMSVRGGIQGLLAGGPASSGAGGAAAGSSPASSSGPSADSSGRSAGEQDAARSTGDRFGKSAQGVLGSLGPAGQAVATGIGVISGIGAKAASLMADQTNQTGVGQNTYGPDFSGARTTSGQTTRPGGQSGPSRPGREHADQSGGQEDDGGSGDDGAVTGPMPALPMPAPPMPAPAGPPAATPTGPGGPGGAGRASTPPEGAGGGSRGVGSGEAAGVKGAGGAAGTATAVPPVP